MSWINDISHRQRTFCVSTNAALAAFWKDCSDISDMLFDDSNHVGFDIKETLFDALAMTLP